MNKLLPATYFDEYKQRLTVDLSKQFKNLKPVPLKDDLTKSSFIISAVASSNIEGNTVDLNSYMRYIDSGKKFENKSLFEIECLINAYEFAKVSNLTLKNLLQAHKTYAIALNIHQRDIGAIRTEDVGIYLTKQNERPVKIYSAADKAIVKEELQKLFQEVVALNKTKLSIDEAFYFASLLHLVFVKIHPFADGNGRGARLVEKWFLAHHLGKAAWHIPSESYYWNHIRSYYSRLKIGKTYESNNYAKCVPFLLLLSQSLK